MKSKFSYGSKNLRTQLLCGLLQFTAQLFFCDFVATVEFSTESPCGSTNLSNSKGTITSPNYPRVYPHVITCEWKIHSPAYSVLRINIVDLDIQEDNPCHKPPCCSHQGLLVSSEGGREPILLCGNNSVENTIVFSQPLTIIKYFSTSPLKLGRGFEITYSIDVISCKNNELQCTNGKCISSESFCNSIDDCEDGSDELNCPHNIHSFPKHSLFPKRLMDIKSFKPSTKVCSDGKIPCPFSPDHCYSQLDLCDAEFDCPKGEDEVGCTPGCPDQIACSSGTGCYYPSQRCNLKRNCRDNSDETGCPAVPCIAMQFTCLNGACVSGSAICDGDDDCGDLSDEENCTKSSFMTAAIMGLLSCIFLFCIGLSCLYRVYSARLRASNGFAYQLEPEPVDEFMYREPPPAYSVAVGEAGVFPYQAPEIMERFFETDHAPQPYRIQNTGQHGRHRSSRELEPTTLPRSRPRPSALFTTLSNSISQVPEVQCQPKMSNECRKNISAANRSNLGGVIELLGFSEEISQSQENCTQTANYQNESSSSSLSLSSSRESVTSSTSLEDHEDLMRHCQS